LIPFNEDGTSVVTAEGNRGCFALVCYVADPLKSAIEVLRQAIPGKQLPPVHVTVLPPRPLLSDAESACALVRKATQKFAPFEAELSEVRCFPETNFLYLDIAAGSSRLRELHASLNSGELEHTEPHEYRPHLTLGGPVPAELLAKAEGDAAEQWSKMRERRVRVEQLSCLWLPEQGSREWTRVASYSLTEPAVRQTARTTIRKY
jgi:2'-5' RNA ligase